MNTQDAPCATIWRRLGCQVTGSADLALLAFSSLPDDQIIEAMRRLALGLDPGIDLAACAISEAEWERRRAKRRLQRPLPVPADLRRRRRRKAAKRRQRPR